MPASSPRLLQFDELALLQQVLDAGAAHLQAHTLCEVDCGPARFPVLAATLGSDAPDAPAVGFFGGVHGLERIGALVVIHYLRHLIKRLAWDESLQQQLTQVRMVFMPIVNPGGMWRGTRANPQGVDLMRNAPIDSRERVAWLLGGHRHGPWLPWYRGPADAPMQREAQALCEVVHRELLGRPFALAIDCHSGFGLHDRLWFPHAHTRTPFAHLAEVHALLSLFEDSHPHHRYVFEPQSRQYLTHGDLWDHLSLPGGRPSATPFLPLTLEMGSWTWVRKSPRQLFSRQGIFNPLPLHRQQRVLRRHFAWLDFVTRAAASFRQWLPAGIARDRHHEAALTRWYGDERRRTAAAEAPVP